MVMRFVGGGGFRGVDFEVFVPSLVIWWVVEAGIWEFGRVEEVFSFPSILVLDPGVLFLKCWNRGEGGFRGIECEVSVPSLLAWWMVEIGNWEIGVVEEVFNLLVPGPEETMGGAVLVLDGWVVGTVLTRVFGGMGVIGWVFGLLPPNIVLNFSKIDIDIRLLSFAAWAGAGCGLGTGLGWVVGEMGGLLTFSFLLAGIRGLGGFDRMMGCLCSCCSISNTVVNFLLGVLCMVTCLALAWARLAVLFSVTIPPTDCDLGF